MLKGRQVDIDQVKKTHQGGAGRHSGGMLKERTTNKTGNAKWEFESTRQESKKCGKINSKSKNVREVTHAYWNYSCDLSAENHVTVDAELFIALTDNVLKVQAHRSRFYSSASLFLCTDFKMISQSCGFALSSRISLANVGSPVMPALVLGFWFSLKLSMFHCFLL